MYLPLGVTTDYDHVSIFIKKVYCNDKEQKILKVQTKTLNKNGSNRSSSYTFMSDVKKRPDFFYEIILLQTPQGDFMGHEF